MVRTVSGVRHTLMVAERDNWTDYGRQARADVAYLLRLLSQLRPEGMQANVEIDGSWNPDGCPYCAPDEACAIHV